MLPPDQRRHASFSETRMNGAKQLSFCGAVARALLIGVGKTCDGAALSESKRMFPTRAGRRESCPLVDISQSLQRVNTRESCVYFWKRRRGILKVNERSRPGEGRGRIPRPSISANTYGYQTNGIRSFTSGSHRAREESSMLSMPLQTPYGFDRIPTARQGDTKSGELSQK